MQNASGGVQQTVLTPQVVIGGVVAKVLFSGLAPGFPGLYQVNVQVPGGVASGAQTLNVSVNGLRSNDVKIQIK